MRCAPLLVAAAAVALAATARAQTNPPHTLRTWAGTAITADTIELGDASVTLRAGGTPRTLGWHEIRAIEGPLAGESAARLALGKVVWRAGARLAKGDSFGAEPLFERAFEDTRGSVGVTPAFVADGLLRCRLRRDARAAAIDAWLELAANLSVAPARTPNWGLDSPAIDPRTRLVPSLPPIWFDSAPARAFASALPAAPPGEQPADRAPDGGPPPGREPYAAAIRDLYRAAARAAVGDPIDASAVSSATAVASRREGGALAAQVVLAQVGGAEGRAAARDALAREQSLGNERWRAVWATLAIGRSLTREPGEADIRRGILELLSIHAIDAEVLPYLTAIALADAARAADAIGDDRAAAAIRADLRRDYPEHPVRELPGLTARSVRDPAAREPGAHS
jgi:hypothetical protein